MILSVLISVLSSMFMNCMLMVGGPHYQWTDTWDEREDCSRGKRAEERVRWMMFYSN